LEYSEIYYSKGWKAFVNGKRINRIVEVDYAFKRGLPIPAGMVK